MLMGIIPNLSFLKLESSGFMRLVLSTNCAVRHLLYRVSTMSHMSSKKHSNAAGQSSRGSSNKGRMQLTSYLWKKIGMLWKNYGKAMEFLFWGSVRTLTKKNFFFASIVYYTTILCTLEQLFFFNRCKSKYLLIHDYYILSL